MHDERIPEDLPQLGEQGVVIDERQLVKQKDVSVPHRDDVAVESSSVDAARMLLGKEGARAVDLAEARDRFRCLTRLPRRKLQGLRRLRGGAVRSAPPG